MGTEVLSPEIQISRISFTSIFDIRYLLTPARAIRGNGLKNLGDQACFLQHWSFLVRIEKLS
jgi:hypothetical protein